MPESLSAAVRVDQPAEVRVDAYPGTAFAGRVSRINPTVEASTRAFQLELTVPNLDGRLKAGGFARAGILLAADAGVLTVPAAALVSLAGVNKVFVIDGGTAKAVEVAVGVREKDWLEVRAAGLRAGDERGDEWVFAGGGRLAGCGALISERGVSAPRGGQSHCAGH